MSEFTIEGFATACKDAMAAAKDEQRAASSLLRRTMKQHGAEEILDVLEAATPPGADIGEMIVHVSPELTLLHARVPPRFQSGIHDHTVFACIGQLVGQEKNVFYERNPDGAGLRVLRETTTRPGDVIDLPADAVHCIENPGTETSGALHVYGGDFRAVMDQRTLWTSQDHEPLPFTFERLLAESAATMKRDGNMAGLEALAEAIPSVRPLLEAEDKA